MKEFKIALIGHSFCCSNFGLGALGYGEIHALNEVCSKLGISPSFVCFEGDVKSCYYDGEIPNVSFEKFYVKKPLKMAKRLKGFDLIVDIGAGDSFSDLYGMKLFIVQMLTKIAVMQSKTNYVFAPQTIGPFKNSVFRAFANRYISKSCLAASRDELSFECLNNKNRKKVYKLTDVAFMMPSETLNKNEKFTVGINVSGLLYNKKSSFSDSQSYKKIIDSIINYCKSQSYRVVLIPHVVWKDESSLDNDLPVCLKLSKDYSIECINSSSPKEAKKNISQCDFFIGSRMHSTIAAISKGVHTLPLAYSRKFKGLFDSIGYYYTMDLNDCKCEDIIKSIQDMIAHADIVELAIMNSWKNINEKECLYKNLLEEQIKGMI